MIITAVKNKNFIFLIIYNETTSVLILIDKRMQIRGYYYGLDSASLLKLAKDVGYLMLEKDKTKKNKLFQDIVDLSWLWLVIALLVSWFVYYFNTKFNKTTTK